VEVRVNYPSKEKKAGVASGEIIVNWNARKYRETGEIGYAPDEVIIRILEYIFEDCYGVKTKQYPDAEVSTLRIDLHNTELDGWQLNNILDNPHEACRYCNPDRTLGQNVEELMYQ